MIVAVAFLVLVICWPIGILIASGIKHRQPALPVDADRQRALQEAWKELAPYDVMGDCAPKPAPTYNRNRPFELPQPGVPEVDLLVRPYKTPVTEPTPMPVELAPDYRPVPPYNPAKDGIDWLEKPKVLSRTAQEVIRTRCCSRCGGDLYRAFWIDDDVPAALGVCGPCSRR